MSGKRLSARALPRWSLDPVRRKPSATLLRLERSLCGSMPPADVATLQRLWQHDDIIIQCKRPQGLEDQPDLAQRIRGAIGNALELLCSLPPLRPDPFDRENAHELLYFWHSPTADTCFGVTEIAVPMVIRATMTARSIDFVIRLFGRAGIHRPMVEAAALNAVAGGVSLRNHAIRVPFPVTGLSWRKFDGGAHRWPSRATTAQIRYITPVIIRSIDRLRLDPEAVLKSSLRRIAALSPWMGFALQADAAALNQAIDHVHCALDIHPEQWVRTSRRTPGESIKTYGFGGGMRISGNLDPIMPYLTLGEFGSIGGECASGYGAYTMVPYP